MGKQKEKVYGGNVTFLLLFCATLNTDTLNVSYNEQVYSNLGVFMQIYFFYPDR